MNPLTRFRRGAWFILPALLALRAGAAEPSVSGWDLLRQGGSFAQAETAFRAEIERNGGEAGAAYGLAMIQQARGERERAFVTALEGLKSGAGHPLAFLLQDVVQEDAAFNGATAALARAALPGLTANPGMDPIVRFDLRWLGYDLASRSGDRGERLKARVEAGFVPGAFFSNPIAHLSRSAFYEEGPAERGRLSEETWKYSAFTDLQCSPPDHWVPQDREFDIYALLPFRIDRPAEALIYANSSRSFRMGLDDKTLCEKDFFSVQADPTALWQVALKPGYHRLLVKMHGGRGVDGIHFALLDALGNPLPVQWEMENPLSGEGPAGFADRGDRPDDFVKRFPTDDPLYAGFKALWLRWRGDVARARLEMEKAAALQPRCLAWDLWTARMYLLEAEDLPGKIAQSRAEKALNDLLAAEADLPLGLYFKGLLQLANSDGDEGLLTLSKLTETASMDPRWFIALAERFQEKGWAPQARATLEAASSYHPQCESVESAWIAFDQHLPDRAAEHEAILRLQALRNADPEWEDFYGSTRQWDDLRTLLEAEAARYGDQNLHFGEKLAKLELRAGKTSAAIERLESLVAQDPEDANFALLLASARFANGDAAGAKQVWTRLKDRKPDAFQVDLARWAMGEPMPFQDRHLSLERVLAEDTSTAPEASPSSLLLDQMFTTVQKDGSSVERYHGVVRINDKEGVDRESEQAMQGQVVLSLRTIKPDGRILEPEQIPDKETISMQGLEAGDIIEYEYLTLKRPSGVKPNAYVTSQVYLFQDLEKPFHRTQWFVQWPDSIAMKLYEQNLPAAGRKGSADGMQWRDWDYRDMPRVAPEPDTPNRAIFVPLVEAVGGIDWKDIGRYLKEGVTGAFQITPEVEAAYQEAVKGAATPEAKYDGIVRYLLKAIDGERGGWQDPTQTLLTRQGSRLPVAAAFLKLAGIPFDVLVAEAVPDRVYRENLARLGQFGTPLLRVQLPGGARTLALASPYRDPAILPWYLQGARAMVVSDKEPWREIVIPADFSPWQKAMETETRLLTSDGNLKIEHKQTMDPEASEGLRSSLAKMDKEQWRQAVQMALAKQFGNLDLLDFDVTGVDEPMSPLGWNFTVLVHGYALSDGHRLTVPDPLPSLRLGRALASLRERHLPLMTGGPIYVNQKLTLHLPPGSQVDYPLPKLDASSAFGSYRLQSSQHGDEVEVERQVQMPYQVVWPPQYEAFASFLRRTDEAESGQLTVTVP